MSSRLCALTQSSRLQATAIPFWHTTFHYPSADSGYCFLLSRADLFDGQPKLVDLLQPADEGGPVATLRYGKKIWADNDRKGPFYVLYLQADHAESSIFSNTNFEDILFVR